MKLSEKAQEVLKRGEIKLRVYRSGMYQWITFRAKVVTLGNITYNELHTERMIELTELTKIANEVGLPIEAPNGRAFPTGTSSQDFKNE